jgi:hypothetical protein
MVLSRKYGEPPVRVVRKSHPDRLGYIYVHAKHVDEDEQNPKLLAEHRRRAFFERAERCLREGKNLVICPVEKQSSTSLHSGSLRMKGVSSR